MSPLIVIVGETGSGKTSLSIALAKRFNGEIVAADSRSVYTGMDIGTAKPTARERQGVPHYGLDVVEPGEEFSAYDFKILAESAIATIAGHGRLPFMVGGTGLYVDAVIYDYKFRAKPSAAARHKLTGLTIQELQERIVAAKLPLPANSDNPRHLSRLLESGEPPSQHRKLRDNTIVLGISLPRAALAGSIGKRVDGMIEAGLVDETRKLLARYGSVEALRTPGYKAIARFINGELSLDEAKQQFVRDDLGLAKRQRTWFKRNKDIHWLSGENIYDQAIALITPLINR